MNRAEVIRKVGRFDSVELAAIAAALVEVEDDTICQVVMAVSVHGESGGHELLVATTIEDDPKAVAALMRHGADHIHGGCESCRRRNRRGGQRD